MLQLRRYHVSNVYLLHRYMGVMIMYIVFQLHEVREVYRRALRFMPSMLAGLAAACG